jgi:hypothetical protein
LTEKGYRVLVQDYDIPIGASFIEVMHEAVKNSRDLVILLTRDYEQSPYTRKEFTSFEAQRLQNPEERHMSMIRRSEGAALSVRSNGRQHLRAHQTDCSLEYRCASRASQAAVMNWIGWTQSCSGISRLL